jgi:hypothetical protein
MKTKQQEQGPVSGKTKDLLFAVCKEAGEKVAGEALGKGMKINDEQLALINKFALIDLTADEVYARKIRLANNAIDRDVERFSEKLLEDFAKTLPGKSLLLGHKRDGTGEGLFFAAEIEKMSLADARKMTGEELHLPDGMKEVWFLNTWFYTVKLPSLEDFLKKIDAGINRHASIGFSAANVVKISDDDTGDVIYWEYKGPGEAQEGSLVYLGAQRAATTTKGVKPDGVHIEEDEKTKLQKIRKEEKRMKKVLVLLGLDESASEDAGLKALNLKIERLKFLEPIIALLGEEITIDGLKELKASAADGVAYRDNLVKDTLKFGVLIKEVGEKAEEQTSEGDFLKTLPIERLKSQRDKFEKKAREDFPTDPMFKGKDESDRATDDLKGKKKKPPTGGKKDYSNPENNDLFETVG